MGHSDSNLVTLYQPLATLLKKRCDILEKNKNSLPISLNLKYMEAVFQYLKAKIK